MHCLRSCVRARVWAGGCVDGWAVVRWVDVRMDVWLCVVVCGFVWLCVVVCGGVWWCVVVCGGGGVLWRWCVVVCGGVRATVST